MKYRPLAHQVCAKAPAAAGCHGEGLFDALLFRRHSDPLNLLLSRGKLAKQVGETAKATVLGTRVDVHPAVSPYTTSGYGATVDIIKLLGPTSTRTAPLNSSDTCFRPNRAS